MGAAKAAEEADAAAASGKGKKNKNKRPYEDPDERRKRIGRERFLQKKADAKAERDVADRKIRASARRAKKSIRPGRGFEDAPAPKAKKKKDKNKGKKGKK